MSWKNSLLKNILFFLPVCCMQFFSPIHAQTTAAFVIVLGIVQDGGCPHPGCMNDCCKSVINDPSLKKYIVSLAVVDPLEKKWWLFEASPDVTEQFQLFQELTKNAYPYLPDGIFITHAHIGHYTGLMQLGKEAMNSKEVPVYVMPRMKQFLETNGPWSQLVQLKNIVVNSMQEGDIIYLGNRIRVQAFQVPHRDEFSETAGFKIFTPQKYYLFIPDIDKWTKWNKKISDEVAGVDFAFLDGTFNSSTELKNRNIEDIPHPLIYETMDLFKEASPQLRSKIVFIHFNHSNPALWSRSEQKIIKKKGFQLAVQGKSY
jgi:pyrroloquinoline quinone biosynthesis protein B